MWGGEVELLTRLSSGFLVNACHLISSGNMVGDLAEYLMVIQTARTPLFIIEVVWYRSELGLGETTALLGVDEAM